MCQSGVDVEEHERRSFVKMPWASMSILSPESSISYITTIEELASSHLYYSLEPYPTRVLLTINPNMNSTYALRSTTRWTDECPWPRRLLHVNSMRSYPWKPGNMYGNYREPRYKAITYTWGRFTLQQGGIEYNTTKPLHINGISWQVPRVKTSHFTAEQLHNILKTTAFPPEDEEDTAADFIWLDIACIDQAYPRTREYYSEVGRQAKIFRGAQEVMVWLTMFDGNRLGKWWTSLKEIEGPVIGVEVGNPPGVDLNDWMGRVKDHLREMKTDPWFSSLWTLQEAFLCPAATILCRDGRYRDQFGRVGNSYVRSGLLKDLVSRWNDIPSRLRRLERVEEFWGFKLDQREFGALVAEIGSIGFLDAVRWEDQMFQIIEGNSRFDEILRVTANPFMLLAASHRRECSEQTDRVRGIMQVFNLRLGESSPSAIPGKTYSLSELEDELGSALLQMYPISSQLMKQDRSCSPRKAWRVSAEMTLLEHTRSLWRQLADEGDPANIERELVLRTHGARLSAQKFEATWVVGFQGRYSPIGTFVSVLDKLLSPHSVSLHLDGKWSEELRNAALTGPYYTVKEFDWLANRFRDRNLGILFLARARPPPKGRKMGDVYCDWGIGLILCRERDRMEVYQRLGVLIWDFHTITDLMKMYGWQLQATNEVLDGYGYLDDCTTHGWTDLYGHFG